MNIEDKLDQIIELLSRIDAKLSPPGEQRMPDTEVVIPPKPTKGMLKFKQMIEFTAEIDRKFFFSAIRKYAPRYMEIRQHDPSHRLSFKPQMTPKIDEKIQKTGAQFYKNLRTWSDNYSRAVEAEGEKVLQRAIGRLTTKA
jgi:hypothetical protein